MKTSLVTGGAGFIGSHIVDRLLGLGHNVIVIDNESSEVHAHFYFNEKATYHKLDVADYQTTRSIYDGIDYVFHCAAESRIEPCNLNPILAFKTNTLGTATVLQCAREAGVKKVMYSSTSSGYGLVNEPPLEETMPDDCLNPYSVSKVSGEKICRMYTKLFGVKSVVFRYFNVYGPREPLKGPYAPLIGLFLRQYRAKQPLTIVPDGTQRRDFIHVDDVCSVIWHCINSKNKGSTYNVGSGVASTWEQVANTIFKTKNINTGSIVYKRMPESISKH